MMTKAAKKHVVRAATPAKVEAPVVEQTIVEAPVVEAPAKVDADKVAKIRYQKRTWTGSDIITVLRENPKTGESKKRYALYRTGMTVDEYVKAVVDAGLGTKTLANNDLRWDTSPDRKGGQNIAIAAKE
jgi:hypothetical protein